MASEPPAILEFSLTESQLADITACLDQMEMALKNLAGDVEEEVEEEASISVNLGDDESVDERGSQLREAYTNIKKIRDTLAEKLPIRTNEAEDIPPADFVRFLRGKAPALAKTVAQSLAFEYEQQKLELAGAVAEERAELVRARDEIGAALSDLNRAFVHNQRNAAVRVDIDNSFPAIERLRELRAQLAEATASQHSVASPPALLETILRDARGFVLRAHRRDATLPDNLRAALAKTQREGARLQGNAPKPPRRLEKRMTEATVPSDANYLRVTPAIRAKQTTVRGQERIAQISQARREEERARREAARRREEILKTPFQRRLEKGGRGGRPPRTTRSIDTPRPGSNRGSED
eukprot:gnl/Chilomastix_cuspidata/2575.p1 GENE.gnl/Chilomastix_cuspidata/2575~~gnl/Chilomastix_cuspidata/2575.p1  ORF type:complete len:363 (+),score=120.66 gnl/Chilomastix_cuspidata/2575:31-1089(+)